MPPTSSPRSATPQPSLKDETLGLGEILLCHMDLLGTQPPLRFLPEIILDSPPLKDIFHHCQLVDIPWVIKTDHDAPSSHGFSSDRD
jgi:hypothetical protein